MNLQPKPEQCIECNKVMTWEDEMASNAVAKGGTTKGLCKGCRHLAWETISKQFENKEENQLTANGGWFSPQKARRILIPAISGSHSTIGRKT